MENLAYKYKTAEEYLAFERAALDKHEYYKGEVFAMSGNSLRHNQIQINFIGETRNFLKGKPCKIFGSELRVHVPLNQWYTYPDAIIVCDEPQMMDDEFDTLLNPAVIIEILSKSTQSYDRGDKFSLYRSISSLQEYILINSDKVAIEQYNRQPDGTWILKEFGQEKDNLVIQSIQFSFPLLQLYDGVKFKAS